MWSRLVQFINNSNNNSSACVGKLVALLHRPAHRHDSKVSPRVWIWPSVLQAQDSAFVSRFSAVRLDLRFDANSFCPANGPDSGASASAQDLRAEAPRGHRGHRCRLWVEPEEERGTEPGFRETFVPKFPQPKPGKIRMWKDRIFIPFKLKHSFSLIGNSAYSYNVGYLCN